MAYVYTLANAKGGCGKSTIAFNLAVSFARKGYQTLAIDLDQQVTCQVPWVLISTSSSAPLTCTPQKSDTSRQRIEVKRLSPIDTRGGARQELQLPLPDDPSGYHAHIAACRGELLAGEPLVPKPSEDVLGYSGSHILSGSRMSCQVEMQDSTRSDLHHDEHIENAEARRCGNKEIARYHGLGMIADKRLPALRRQSKFRSCAGPHVTSDRPRRKAEAQSHQKFGSDPLLAPRRIVRGHLLNQRLNVL